jgi:hypothetical protein
MSRARRVPFVTSDASIRAISRAGDVTLTADPAQKAIKVAPPGKINGGGERVELYAEDGDSTSPRST